jgi:hypothetical protein
LKTSILVKPPRSNVKKLFTAMIYECWLKGRVLVPGRPFQPNVMFAGKVRSLSYIGVTEKRFTLADSSFTHTY